MSEYIAKKAATERRSATAPKHDYSTAASLLIAFLLIVLAVRKLPQEEHANDRGNADTDNDDEFCSHDPSFSETGCPP